MANYVHALLFGAASFYFMMITLLHQAGYISAAWIIRPGWMALQIAWCLTAILALVAGYGLRHLEPWALGVELMFLLCFIIQWPLAIIAYSRPFGLGDFAAGASLMAAFSVPLMNLWEVRRSPAMKPEYRRIVAATPGIRVGAALPRELKLSTIALAIIYFVICAIID